MLRSYRFSRPLIESCTAKHDVIWNSSVTPVKLDLKGWGWLSIYVEGSPSKFTRIFRGIFWPSWVTGSEYPSWPVFKTFVASEQVEVIR